MAPFARAALAAAVAVLVAVAPSACGEESEDQKGTAGSIEDDLGGLPGVQEVSVTEDTIEDGGDPTTEVVVSLEPEPTDEDVVGVLEALAETGWGRNAAYVDSPGTPWLSSLQAGISGVRNVQADSDLDEAAEILATGLQVADELGGEAAVDVNFNPYAGDVDRAVTITPASPSPSDVRAAVAAVEADPVLSGAQALVLGQTPSS